MTTLEYEKRSEERNEAAKYLSSVIGNNLSFWLCCAIPFLAIMFIWVDTSLPQLGWALLGEGIPVVLLMVIGERLMIGIGAKTGKTDKGFMLVCDDFTKKKDSVIQSCGRMAASEFCEWYIVQEFRETFTRRLRKLHLSEDEYRGLTGGKLMDAVLRLGVGRRFFGYLNLCRLDYIALTPDMMFDEETEGKQRGLGESGDERVYAKTWGAKGILVAVITAACSVSVAMTVVSDISWYRVLYTALKVMVILYRMARGFNDGVTAFNRVEVAHKKRQIMFLGLYEEYCQEQSMTRDG